MDLDETSSEEGAAPAGHGESWQEQYNDMMREDRMMIRAMVQDAEMASIEEAMAEEEQAEAASCLPTDEEDTMGSSD